MYIRLAVHDLDRHLPEWVASRVRDEAAMRRSYAWLRRARRVAPACDAGRPQSTRQFMDMYQVRVRSAGGRFARQANGNSATAAVDLGETPPWGGEGDASYGSVTAGVKKEV